MILVLYYVRIVQVNWACHHPPVWLFAWYLTSGLVVFTYISWLLGASALKLCHLLLIVAFLSLALLCFALPICLITYFGACLLCIYLTIIYFAYVICLRQTKVYHFALAQDSLNLFCSFAFLNMIMWFLERNLLEILVIECTLLKANGNTNRHYRGCDLIDLMTNLYKLLILSVRF